ncbi:histidine kinase [Streptomyces sp. NBC_00190]|uniref:sensor histidine kinase n=1 Tax=unclassified Streptomyces TaxID=2593676 RepID=UPI002E2B38FC|nr:histidine kinase [Streptomyces sp. NBC_00190]
MPETTAAMADLPSLRILRADLITIQSCPMPPLSWPRWLRWLPHSLVCLAAALTAAAAGATAPVPATGHAAMLVVALRRPASAWWLSMAFLTGITLEYPPTHDTQIYVWMVHAGVLFLLALRVRLFSAITAAVFSALSAVLLKLSGSSVGSWKMIIGALALFAVAVVIGAVVRGRREDHARLTEQIAATARERALRTVLEERTRIARELHDVVAHHLSLISIQADAAPYRVQGPPPELVAELASIRANALEGLAELRHMLDLLRSNSPGDSTTGTSPQPSLAQLDGLLGNVRAAGLRATVRIEGTARHLPPGVELSAYRIIQEALSNVLRHAPGAETHVELVYARDTLGLRVVNGPAPLPAAPSPGAGHGVIGMRERIAMLGGDLAVGPAPDGGYKVSAALPTCTAPAVGKETYI